MPAMTQPARVDRRGVGLALGAAFLWSLTGVALRFIETASTWLIIGLRSLTMLAVLVPLLALSYRGGLARAFVAMGWPGAIGGVSLGLGFTCYISAIQTTTVANVAVIVALVPLVAAVMARLALGEAIAGRTWTCAAVAGLGAALMVAEGIAFGGWLGNLLALGAVLCQGTYTVALRRGRGVDMLPVIAVGALVSAALTLAVAGSVEVSAHDLGLIAAVGIVSTLVGNAVFILAARRLGAAVLALLSMAEIVLSPLWVALAVGERPTPWALAGGAIIVGAVLAQVIGSLRAERGSGPA